MPVIFILLEIITIYSIDEIIKYSNCQILYKKFKDIKLETYIKEKYGATEKLLLFISLGYLAQFIYFLVGLFYIGLFFISTVYIFCSLINMMYIKFKPKVPIEKTIKKAKLEDFHSDDIKFERLLKINELNSKKIKNYDYSAYIISTIKILAFIAIIVLHYHYNII